MPTSVTWNGTSYAVPSAGELNWASLSTFLNALGTSAAVAEEMKQAIRIATTSPVTVASATDFAVLTNLASAGAVAVNLPAGVTGQVFIIKDEKGDAATNNITITPNGAETIGGAATSVLNHNKQMVIIQFITGDWRILLSANYPGTLVDADISATAAIARSKIAAGTAYRVLANSSTGALSENAALTAALPIISDANGQLTTETYLDKTRGGTGITSTATFPSSGTVATIAGTQALTNKDIDGGTASDSLRITLPKNTKTLLDGLTRKEGTIAYATDLLKPVFDNGSSLQVIGSGTGTGGLNYIANPDASVDTTGWHSVGNQAITRTTTAARPARGPVSRSPGSPSGGWPTATGTAPATTGTGRPARSRTS